jgi:hypothetical protein
MSKTKPSYSFAVIGEGWSAIGALATHLLSNPESSVLWIAGTGARLLPPIAGMGEGPGAEVLAELGRRLKSSWGEPDRGANVREFKNKAFQIPAWARAGEDSALDTWCELLGESERRFVPMREVTFEKPLIEIEEEIRAYILSQSRVTRVEGVPVHGISSGDRVSLRLGDGRQFEADSVVYADSWNALRSMEGLPKVAGLKGLVDGFALQLVCTHRDPVHAEGGSAVRESFFCQPLREPNESIRRQVWGHFFDGGKRSIWTLFLASDESEDNHEIAKKIRRMKQTLNKMFVGGEWLGAKAKEFTDTILDEHVRFEEAIVVQEGDEPSEIPAIKDAEGASRVCFLHDGFGPAFSWAQIGKLWGVSLSSTSGSPESPSSEAQLPLV